MLRDAAGVSKIYIACGFTDMRKGIPGLTSIIQKPFGLDPLERGTLFLFSVIGVGTMIMADEPVYYQHEVAYRAKAGAKDA